jgi:hypothetical protein
MFRLRDADKFLIEQINEHGQWTQYASKRVSGFRRFLRSDREGDEVFLRSRWVQTLPALSMGTETSYINFSEPLTCFLPAYSMALCVLTALRV